MILHIHYSLTILSNGAAQQELLINVIQLAADKNLFCTGNESAL